MNKGKLSINSENIFPIIKRWLYSDHNIFARELISNAADAITKLRTLAAAGEYQAKDDEKFEIFVIKDEANSVLRFIDNGIGMNADEIKKYINDIAFSGAEDFLAAYKDKAESDQIIGHFGLGFYSAFMVASSVEIHTLSYREGSEAVHWKCDGGTDFEMGASDKKSRGTEIVLHIADDSKEFLTYSLDAAIRTYCSYMPYPIYVMSSDEYKKLSDADPAASAPLPINDTNPLYLKSPGQCTDEEYKEFYKKAFFDFKDPIFWIHLNMDYPFNLKGIIYFPKAKSEYEFAEGRIKLYNSQVFVADNIGEVIPEFLTTLNGVIDCPDLPLNVSRSALQNDGFAKKIRDYIGKKVADKLRALSTSDRHAYEQDWSDIGSYIEFGVIRDAKFSEQMKDNLLFMYVDGSFATLSELKSANTGHESNSAEKSDSTGTDDADETESKTGESQEITIFYTTDPIRQAQYIEAQEAEGNRVVVLRHAIEQALISHLEATEQNLKFKRVDSISDSTAGDAEELSDDKKALFDSDTLIRQFKDTSVAAMFAQPEEDRRNEVFAKLYGIDLGAAKKKLILNKNNPTVAKILAATDVADEDVRLAAKFIEALARISTDDFTKEQMQEFAKISGEVLNRLV